MSYIQLKVEEGDDPLYTVSAIKRLPDGTETPFDLTGGTITLRVKATKDTADGSAMGSFTGVVVGNPLDGTFTVQVTNTVTNVAGDYWYTIKWVAAAKQQTLQYGEWRVTNT